MSFLIRKDDCKVIFIFDKSQIFSVKTNKDIFCRPKKKLFCTKFVKTTKFVVMEKIEMQVKDISPSRIEIFYDVLLVENGGERALTIPVSEYEAQNMAMSMDNTESSRPLTYDSYIETLTMFNIRLLEVTISRFFDGIYYSFAVFATEAGEIKTQEMRTSDAINLALKAQVPIYASLSVLNDVGFSYDTYRDIVTQEFSFDEEILDIENMAIESFGVNMLTDLLKDAIAKEDYITASKLRDRIKEISSSQDFDC